MTSRTKLWALSAGALALSLALAGCGGGGSSSGPRAAVSSGGSGGGGGGGPAEPTPQTVNLATVTPDYQALEPTGDNPIVIGAGTSADHGDVAFMCETEEGDGECTVTVAEDGTVTATGGTVTASDSTAYTMRLAEEKEGRAAEGMRIAMAIDPDSTRADADAVTAGNQLPFFSIRGGMVTNDDPSDTPDAADDLTKLDDMPATVDGWTGAMHMRTTETEDDSATTDTDETMTVVDKVVSYTDFTMPGPESFDAYYTTASGGLPDDQTDADSVVAGDPYVDWPTVVNSAADVDHDSDVDTEEVRRLTLSVAAIVAAERDLFVASQFGITAPHQNIPAPTDDASTSDVNEAMVSFTGTFHGVSGTFACDTGCSISSDENSKLDALGGTWTFTPDDTSMMVAGVKRDVDYLDFGYWLQTTTDSDGTMSHKVLAFAQGERNYGDVSSVNGTASYNGAATGLYVKKTAFDPVTGAIADAKSGQFTASAALAATFGRGSGAIAVEDTFTITGSVSDFMDASGAVIDDNWRVVLDNLAEADDADTSTDGIQNIASSAGTFSGVTTGDGAWSGSFYGAAGSDNALPNAVSGTFDAHFDNGHVLGAFGANIVEQE